MEKDFINDLYDIVTEKLMKLAPEDKTNDAYASMKYPRFLPMMRFQTKAFTVKGFGHVMLMRTNAMNGMMKLLTISFTPNEGLNVPYLLIDCMGMKNKKLAYVEYYDCTGKALRFETLLKIKEKYDKLPNYEEKPAWYIAERMEESLIKGGKGTEAVMLSEMVNDSIEEYFNLAQKAEADSENRNGLMNMQRRLLEEGNPSSGTMTKVLGKAGYIDFFKNYVMPV